MGRASVASVAIAFLAVAGCGGGEASSEPDEAEGSGVRVAALGDSITAGSPLWDPDTETRQAIGTTDEQSQFEYWAHESERSLDFTNCGVFGERTDEIARRLDECAHGADVLIVQGGINDIAQGRPVADAADDLRRMAHRGRELGLETYLAEVLPWNNGHPEADEPIAELNDAIRDIGGREDVEVLAFHDLLEDPGEPGTMKPELTIDGDHPSVAGYRLLGDLVAERVTPG